MAPPRKATEYLTVDFFKTKPTISESLKIDSYEIYFEVHGHGKQHITFVTGFSANMRIWIDFVDYYVQKGFSVLLVENRGIYKSTCGNFGRYTTSGMASDIVKVLDYLNWTEDRNLHVVGCSMGGMISFELALQIPMRISTLTLLVTTAHHRPPPHQQGQFWTSLKNMIFPLDEDVSLENVVNDLYHPSWLAKYDPRFPRYTTNKERMHELFKYRWDTEPAVSVRARIGQGLAVQTHKVSNENLAIIRESVPFIQGITAEGDNIIDPECTVEYCAVLGIEPVILKNSGHGVVEDSELELKDLIDALISKSQRNHSEE